MAVISWSKIFLALVNCVHDLLGSAWANSTCTMCCLWKCFCTSILPYYVGL